MSTFNLFTFFRTVIIQLEAEDSFQLTSDWTKSARKNVNKLKMVTPLDSLLLTEYVYRVFVFQSGLID